MLSYKHSIMDSIQHLVIGIGVAESGLTSRMDRPHWGGTYLPPKGSVTRHHHLNAKTKSPVMEHDSMRLRCFQDSKEDVDFDNYAAYDD